MTKYFKIFLAIFPVFIFGCSSSDNDSTASDPTTQYDPEMTLVYDGETLGVYDVQATYDSDNDIYAYTAMLSNGLKIWMGFTNANYRNVGYDILAYLRIGNPDGTNIYSSVKHDAGKRYIYLKIKYDTESSVNVEFSGRIFTDPSNPNSASHYLTGFSTIHYNTITPGKNTIQIPNIVYSDPWKVIGWQQISASGAPIELKIWGYPYHEFRLFFDAVPTVGYYGFNNDSPTNKVILSAFNSTTFQYNPFQCGGVLHIAEVSQNPKRIKGEFSLTGDKTINSIVFDCSYN